MSQLFCIVFHASVLATFLWEITSGTSGTYQRYIEKGETIVTKMRLKMSVIFWLGCHLFSVFTRTEMQHYNTQHVDTLRGTS